MEESPDNRSVGETSYMGKWLSINLTEEKCQIHETDLSLLEKYIGGKGLGFAILDKIAPAPDPYGEDNPLIFVNGPFTGTKIQTSGRTTLVTKSPLTGSILDTHCGGHFGPQLKAAGFDYIVIVGKATRPVTLHITNKKIEFLCAKHLAGKGIFYTNDRLLEQCPGINPSVACIGPAGENLLKISCIGVDKHRQFGRGGAGAVMGSKNLKAIVVDGDLPVVYHDPESFKNQNKALSKSILKNPSIKFRRKKGTMLWVRRAQELEILPTRNFQQGQFDKFEDLTSETARQQLNWKDTSCFNCAIRCSKWARFDSHELEGPEYETAAYLGSGCEISDIKEVAITNELCNDLGLDTISAGVTCSFAMECYEKKLLPAWDGPELNWSDAKAQRQLLRLMVERKGVGSIFADGTREAALKIGKNSHDFAINVFGMELSGVNPMGSLIMGVVLSVADFASHTRLWCIEQDMGEDFKAADIPAVIARGIDETNIRNSLVVCDFVPENLEALAVVLNAATGMNQTATSLQEIGTRITHLARSYNIRNGRKSNDDVLPGRFFNEVSLSGLMKGQKLDKTFFSSLVQDYYKLRDWDVNGMPSKSVLTDYSL